MMIRVVISNSRVFADGRDLGSIREVDTDDGGHVYEAVAHDGTTVRRLSPSGAAHALADAMAAK